MHAVPCHAERALRKQLQEHFGVDMTDRKPLIRQEARILVYASCSQQLDRSFAHHAPCQRSLLDA